MIRSCVLASLVLFCGISQLGCNDSSRSKATGVAAAPGFRISSSSLPSGSSGAPYSTTLTTANGSQPYTWAVISGNLPPGVSLDSSDGKIIGRPTSSGTFDFRARVTDGGGKQAEKDFSILIVPNVAWTQIGFPTGFVGQPFNFDLSSYVLGGAAPYTFSITGGALPPGLTMTSAGVISGTPTTAGAFQVTFRAVSSPEPGSGATPSADSANNTININ